MIKITLTGKPQSTNNLYRRHGNIMYMTTVGKNTKISYMWQIKEQYKEKPLEGDIAVTVRLYFDNKLRRDIDNWNKILLDSATGLLWNDDSQIIRMAIEKHVDKSNPRIEMDIINLS